MAEVKILFPGYVSADSGGHSCSTITLVRDKNLNIVIDPGTMPDPQILIDKLESENLAPDDINIVFLSHSHIDHFRNIGMFKEAKSLDFWGWWEGDIQTDYKDPLSENIRLIKTPGHSSLDMTMLVKTQKGVVAICGDVFWKKDYPKDDPFAENKNQLAQSRRLVLNSADFVIPGHGEMFKVT